MLRKPNFKTKNNHFEKSHNAEICERGPFQLFENPICCKISKKIERWTLWRLKVSKPKKNQKAEGPSVSSGFANARKVSG